MSEPVAKTSMLTGSNRPHNDTLYGKINNLLSVYYLVAAYWKISIWPLTSSELLSLAIYEHVPILSPPPCAASVSVNPFFLSFQLPFAVGAKHQPLSLHSQGPQSRVPVIWIGLKDEVNNIFLNSHQQQDLAWPSLLIRDVEGRV